MTSKDERKKKMENELNNIAIALGVDNRSDTSTLAQSLEDLQESVQNIMMMFPGERERVALSVYEYCLRKHTDHASAAKEAFDMAEAFLVEMERPLVETPKKPE